MPSLLGVHMDKLIKPKALQKGDKIACVSLSSGLASVAFERYQRAKRQFETAFDVQLVEMEHTLDSLENIYQNPQNRLQFALVILYITMCILNEILFTVFYYIIIFIIFLILCTKLLYFMI